MENKVDPNFLYTLSNIVPRPQGKPVGDYSSSVTVRVLPLIGRVHIVNDACGLFQVGFVLVYWVYGTFSTLYIILLPQYNDARVPSWVVTSYLFVSVLCLLSLVKASITNPGRVPLASEQLGLDTADWTFCAKCQRKRPPRAHHCRRCQQCVMRMDHHCPWINNCVGEENHFSFFLLLFYAFLLGFYSFVLTICHFWVWPKCETCDQEAFYIKHSMWFMYLLFAMSANMSIVMFCQLGNQHYNLLLDRTTLDNMRTPLTMENIKLRESSVAYRQMCGRGSMLCWLWPCRRRFPLLQHSERTIV